jgi:hypothetical protein
VRRLLAQGASDAVRQGNDAQARLLADVGRLHAATAAARDAGLSNVRVGNLHLLPEAY